MNLQQCLENDILAIMQYTAFACDYTVIGANNGNKTIHGMLQSFETISSRQGQTQIVMSNNKARFYTTTNLLTECGVKEGTRLFIDGQSFICTSSSFTKNLYIYTLN